MNQPTFSVFTSLSGRMLLHVTKVTVNTQQRQNGRSHRASAGFLAVATDICFHPTDQHALAVDGKKR